jgi:hypothetical protein
LGNATELLGQCINEFFSVHFFSKLTSSHIEAIALLAKIGAQPSKNMTVKILCGW